MKLNESISFSLILSLVRKQTVKLPCLKHQNQILENLNSCFLQIVARNLKPYFLVTLFPSALLEQQFCSVYLVSLTYSLAKKMFFFFPKTLTVNVLQDWLTPYITMKARSQFPCDLVEAESPYFSVVWGVINQRPFISPTTGAQIYCKIPTKSPVPPRTARGPPPPPRRGRR